MPLPIAEVAVLFRWARILNACGTASGDVLAAAADLGSATAVPFIMALRHG
jgi:uncharacterized membrane-anchored protein